MIYKYFGHKILTIIRPIVWTITPGLEICLVFCPDVHPWLFRRFSFFCPDWHLAVLKNQPNFVRIRQRHLPPLPGVLAEHGTTLMLVCLSLVLLLSFILHTHPRLLSLMPSQNVGGACFQLSSVRTVGCSRSRLSSQLMGSVIQLTFQCFKAQDCTQWGLSVPILPYTWSASQIQIRPFTVWCIPNAGRWFNLHQDYFKSWTLYLYSSTKSLFIRHLVHQNQSGCRLLRSPFRTRADPSPDGFTSPTVVGSNRCLSLPISDKSPCATCV